MFCVTSLGFDPLYGESSHYYNNLWKAYMVASCVGRVLNVNLVSHNKFFFAAAEGSFVTIFVN